MQGIVVASCKPRTHKLDRQHYSYHHYYLICQKQIPARLRRAQTCSKPMKRFMTSSFSHCLLLRQANRPLVTPMLLDL